MAIEFICSQCRKTLRVPDEHLGKNARCPSCQTINLIQPAFQQDSFEQDEELLIDQPPAYGSTTFDNPATAHPDAPSKVNQINPFEAAAYHPGRQIGIPHRGGLVLTLGIVALVCNFFLVPGILAWVFGNSDLKQMKAGIMDREGETLTRVGMILGIIATLLPLLGILLYIIFIIIAILISVVGNF